MHIVVVTRDGVLDVAAALASNDFLHNGLLKSSQPFSAAENECMRDVLQQSFAVLQRACGKHFASFEYCAAERQERATLQGAARAAILSCQKITQQMRVTIHFLAVTPAQGALLRIPLRPALSPRDIKSSRNGDPQQKSLPTVSRGKFRTAKEAEVTDRHTPLQQLLL